MEPTLWARLVSRVDDSERIYEVVSLEPEDAPGYVEVRDPDTGVGATILRDDLEFRVGADGEWSADIAGS